MTDFKNALAKILAEGKPSVQRSHSALEFEDIIDAVYPVVVNWIERDCVVFTSEINDALRMMTTDSRLLAAKLSSYANRGELPQIRVASLEESLKLTFGNYDRVTSSKHPDTFFSPDQLFLHKSVLYLSQDKLTDYFKAHVRVKPEIVLVCSL